MKKVQISLTVILSVTGIILAFTVFQSSYLRLAEGLRDVCNSVRYYFNEICGREQSAFPSAVGYSEVFSPGSLLPKDIDGFADNARRFFAFLWDKGHFSAFLQAAAAKLGTFSKFLVLFLPLLVLLGILAKRLYSKPNTRHGSDTKPLRAYKWTIRKILSPVKKFLCGYLGFLSAHAYIYRLWIVLWLLNLNAAAVALDFIAYYLYFAVSFDVGSLYIQFVKLMADLQVAFRVVPPWAFVIAAWLIFDCLRKKRALLKLRHMEARNCGFINELPIVSMACGNMGKKKTTLITDMALSQEVMFRQKALDILTKADMKFPRFPWILFENELKAGMEHGTVYNLATAKAWIEKKRERYARHNNAAWQLYGYNGKTEYDDGLKVSDIFDILETYAQAYFIYVIETSLIVSNYSIRTDNAMCSMGNFPLWDLGFFTGNRRSRFSHILDFDVLRLGRKVLDNNPNAGSFEYGVVCITEIGKERGNMLELKEVKRAADETNQKNDLFNSWLKLCRHSATVDNFPFIKVFTDEQRPESWGADARDLADIMYITDAGEEKLALPLYFAESVITEWAFEKFISLYRDFRYRRGDNTLLVHILKGITAFLFKRDMRIHGRYGYCTVKITKERGTMDGKAEHKKYFLLSGKIYRERFTTDCFSDYFNELAGTCKRGLKDYREYARVKASVGELKVQNSYFINNLYGR